MVIPLDMFPKMVIDRHHKSILMVLKQALFFNKFLISIFFYIICGEMRVEPVLDRFGDFHSLCCFSSL